MPRQPQSDHRGLSNQATPRTSGHHVPSGRTPLLSQRNVRGARRLPRERDAYAQDVWCVSSGLVSFDAVGLRQ